MARGPSAAPHSSTGTVLDAGGVWAWPSIWARLAALSARVLYPAHTLVRPTGEEARSWSAWADGQRLGIIPGPGVCLAGDVLAVACRWLVHASNRLDVLARGERQGMAHALHTPMTTPEASTREHRALRLLRSIAASECAAKSAGRWETVHKYSYAAAPGGRKAREQSPQIKGIGRPVTGWVTPFTLSARSSNTLQSRKPCRKYRKKKNDV